MLWSLLFTRLSCFPRGKHVLYFFLSITLPNTVNEVILVCFINISKICINPLPALVPRLQTHLTRSSSIYGPTLLFLIILNDH